MHITGLPCPEFTHGPVKRNGGKWNTRRGYRLNKSDRALLEELKERYGLAPAKPVSLVSMVSQLGEAYSPNGEEEKSTLSLHDSIDTTDTATPLETPKQSEGASAEATEPSKPDVAPT